MKKKDVGWKKNKNSKKSEKAKNTFRRMWETTTNRKIEPKNSRWSWKTSKKKSKKTKEFLEYLNSSKMKAILTKRCLGKEEKLGLVEENRRIISAEERKILHNWTMTKEKDF